ncbi:MAG: type II toxin-antitoxin system HicB family antitoxin [Dehalococcoidia bacterium]
MLTDYIRAAMHRATYKVYEEDGTFWGEIADFPGVWANDGTLEACRDELEEVLDGWLILGLRRNSQLPVLDGIDLNVKEAV